MRAEPITLTLAVHDTATPLIRSLIAIAKLSAEFPQGSADSDTINVGVRGATLSLGDVLNVRAMLEAMYHSLSVDQLCHEQIKDDLYEDQERVR